MKTFIECSLPILMFTSIAFVLSCQKQLDETSQAHMVFTADIDNSYTKTAVNTDGSSPDVGKVSWELYDLISISDNSNNKAVYRVKSIVNGQAIFEYYSGSELGKGPYKASYNYSGTILTSQTHGLSKLPMTATSETTHLTFTVSCGLLKLTLSKSGESIKYITVTGIPEGGVETIYTLTCSSAVSIDDPQNFYILLPAGNYTKYVFVNAEGKVCTKTAKSGNSTVIENNVINPISFTKSLAFDYEMVDLGLSVKWARCNIGAYSPEQEGDSFAWGETSTKSSFTQYNYVFYNGGSYSNKYNSIDRKLALEATDDAATVLMGDSYRMPTSVDWYNLENNCEWIWTKYNGHDGYLVVAKNNNSIFLPVIQNYYCYWTSVLYGDSARYYALTCTFSEKGIQVTEAARWYGLKIRPVMNCGSD